jgi:23S rRNA (pseudouridine1915-N3)-methyltransferase
LRALSADDAVWVLDQRGRMMSSPDLAATLKKVEGSGRRRLVVVIGGARGLTERVLERADLVWSLSHLTFLHEMARLIAVEQLYRAIKINRGEPYHR